jgi:hypothetical protein
LPKIPLDYGAERSVSVLVRRTNDMTPETTDAVIGACLHLITDRLQQAAAVAKAAQACAAIGHRERAVTIMLDVEQPLYEANTLLNAASLLNRCATD